MAEPVTQNCNHPQLVSLPAGLIGPGLNTLDLKAAGHAADKSPPAGAPGGLSALQIGPQSTLAPVPRVAIGPKSSCRRRSAPRCCC